MAYPVYSDIFQLIEDSITDILANDVSSIMSVLSPVLLSAFTLYVIFVFWSYFETRIEQSMWDIIKRIIAWGVILSFSINIGSYTTNIVPLVTGLGDGLVALMSGSTGVDASLNDLAFTFVEKASQTWEDASGVAESTMAALGIIVIAIFGTIFLVIAGAYIVLAKIFCAILAVLGPIFISLALFPATRQYFLAWVNQVVSYTLVLLILSILAKIFVTFVQKLFSSGGIFDANFDLVTLFYLPTILGVFCIVLIRVTDLAAGLSNGMSMNGFGAAASAITSASRLGGGGKKPPSDGNKNSPNNSLKNESKGK